MAVGGGVVEQLLSSRLEEGLQLDVEAFDECDSFLFVIANLHFVDEGHKGGELGNR